MTKQQRLKVCAADSTEWHKWRLTGIGASEAAAACGISEWMSPLELWHRKRQHLPPIPDNRAMRLGRKLEPVIADEFELETGLKIAERSPGLYRHGVLNYILATPDGIIDDDQGVEIKTINERRADDVLGEEYTDEVPWEWNLQAQQQMEVMGWRTVWFAVLVGGQDFRVYEVQRHGDVIVKLHSKLSQFWNSIIYGPPPEMVPHKNNLQMVRELYGDVHVGEVVDLTDDAGLAWDDYESHAHAVNNIKKIQARRKAFVLAELENAEAGRLPDGRYIRRKIVKRKGYAVEPAEYVDVRVVNRLT